MVVCLRLNFWPNITLEWFQRERYWPDPETLCGIRVIGCTLVRKAIADEEKTWRLSFSEAEGILANHQTPFQKMSYLLAKLIFTLETHGLVDDETERKLSSYHLKTAYLFTLENTQPEDFEVLQQGKQYLKLASMIFERLSKALETGFLPCFFVPEMNLLYGFSRPFLENIRNRLENHLFENDNYVQKLVKNFERNRLFQLYSMDGTVKQNAPSHFHRKCSIM